jgi:mono/diheme cytochrome c family protein
MKLKLIVFIVTLFLGLNMNCQNSPKKVSANLAESMEEGQLIYNDFCISCHMANGEGAGAIFPPLANSDYLKDKQIESIKAVKYGMSGEILVNGKTYNSVMSPLGLSDQEVADVMNYINNSWGNDYDEFYTKSDISKIKP